jgi:hypothetical protein
MAAIVHTLTEAVGVKVSNVHNYDASYGCTMERDTLLAGLPEGYHIAGVWGGSTAFTAVPGPWRNTGGGGKSECLKQ